MGPWPPREVHGVLQEGAEFALCCWGNLELCSSSVSGRPDQGKEQDAFLGTYPSALWFSGVREQHRPPLSPAELFLGSKMMWFC